MEVHSYEPCTYKLQFGIYHVRRHRLNSQANLFSCEKPPELYSCPHCYFKTDLRTVLKEHAIGIHENEEIEEVEDYNFTTYDCENCKFQTFSVLVMLKHVTDGCIETTVSSTFQRKRFECAQCSYATDWRNNLRRHEIRKHVISKDIKWLECDKCRLKFKKASLLRSHVRRKHEIEWHQCGQCSYKSANRSNLRRHTSGNHANPGEIKWFECERCSYRSKYNCDLKRHVRIHLGTQEKPKLPCAQCSYFAKHRQGLRLHVISKHTSAEVAETIERHECDQCPYVSFCRKHLRRHKRYKHTDPEDINWLECDKCEKKCKSASLLRQHVKRKHEVMWHHCARCSYKTVNKGNLQRHAYLKHDDPGEVKWFECDRCLYRSKFESYLKKHVIQMH